MHKAIHFSLIIFSLLSLLWRASPAQATASPTGLLAFSACVQGNWDIYLLDLDTGQLLRLTDDPAEDRFPAFSPDGTQIAFASNRDGGWNIYLLDPSGAIRPLTDATAYDGAPAWSPDGQWIAFESMRAGDLDIWLMDTRGENLRNLTPTSPAGDLEPTWMPDGRLAFVSWRAWDMDIFAIDPYTENEEPAPQALLDSSADEFSPAWGPNGQLAYLSPAPWGPTQVYLDEQSDPRRLTAFSRVEAFTWTPDGNALILLVRQPNSAQLIWHPLQGHLPPRALTPPMELSGPLSLSTNKLSWHALPQSYPPLYQEDQIPEEDGLLTTYRLPGVDAPIPYLSDAVDDSFEAARKRLADELGYDFLSSLSDAFRPIDFASDASQYTSWHKAGRAFDTLFDIWSPGGVDRLDVAYEPIGDETYWRVYLRCARQDGSCGLPLRRRVWDITAEARQQLTGGRYTIPLPGYYVDLTSLLGQYGWERIAAHNDPTFHWHIYFTALEYWHFQKRDKLIWYRAMEELYPTDVLEEVFDWQTALKYGDTPPVILAKGIPVPAETRAIWSRLPPSSSSPSPVLP